MLRNRPFAALWVGSTISSVGDAMTWVALVWIVYSLSGSAGDVSILVVIYTLPVVAGGLVMGPLLDRFEKRKILIWINLLLAAAVATVPLAAHTSTLQVWHLWVVAGLYGLLKMANLAGVPSLVPALVEDDDLNIANAMESISYWVSDAGAPAAAGLLIGLVGGPNVLIFDFVSYVLFASLLTQVRSHVSAAETERPRASSGSIKPALNFVKSSPPILILTLMFMAFNVAEGMLFVLLPVHARTVLGGSAATYGWLLSSLALSALVSSTLVGSVEWRWNLGRSIAVTQTFAGLAVLVLIVKPDLVLSILALVVLGALTAPLTIWAQTVRMRLIPPELRGRVFGTLRTAMQSTPPLGAAIAGFFLSHEAGWRPAVIFLTLCMSVPGAVGWLLPALSGDATAEADHSSSGPPIPQEQHAPAAPVVP